MEELYIHSGLSGSNNRKSLWKAGGNVERSKGKGGWGEESWRRSEEEEPGGRTVLKEV